MKMAIIRNTFFKKLRDETLRGAIVYITTGIIFNLTSQILPVDMKTILWVLHNFSLVPD